MGKVVKGDFTRAKSKHRSGSGLVPGYRLKIAVAFSDPLIWRTVRVPGQMTLAGFHKTIQTCMEWSDTEAHQFLVGKIFYQPEYGIEQMKRKAEYDEAKFELHDLEEGMQFLFTYLYDAGEGWEVEIAVEEVIMEGSEFLYPVLLGGRRACPPEEIGDIHHYQVLLDNREESSGNAKRTIPVVGLPDFDPDFFDFEAINEKLKYITCGN